MYVCKYSAPPAHARTRAHRPAARVNPGQHSGGPTTTRSRAAAAKGKWVVQWNIWVVDVCMYVCKYSAPPVHARTGPRRGLPEATLGRGPTRSRVAAAKGKWVVQWNVWVVDVCMYVCKYSAPPAHARTGPRRGLPEATLGRGPTRSRAAAAKGKWFVQWNIWVVDACMGVCKDSAAPAHARTRAHRPAALWDRRGNAQYSGGPNRRSRAAAASAVEYVYGW